MTKTITLTDEEFNRLYQLIDVEYFKLCKRVEKDRPGLSSNIEDENRDSKDFHSVSVS